MAYLVLQGLRKAFGPTVAVDALNLEVARGELVTLLGPSGCGKTTTLRLIAGFEQPTEGSIWIDGQEVTRLPPERRRIGMVFQSYALFPHMTVAENIAFGLRMARLPADFIRQRLEEMLALIQMSGYGDRPVHQLSGGQQQRVALARALAIQPRLLLLDEPLSALDARIRAELRDEVRRIQRALCMTTIYVTHDQEEALSLSDRVIVMQAGHIEQIGTPFEVYHQPRTDFVARFVGALSVLRGVLSAPNAAVIAGQTVRLPQPRFDKRPGDRVTLALRPEAVILGSCLPDHNCLTARVDGVTFLGSILRVQLALDGENTLIVDLLNRSGLPLPRAGECVVASFAPESIRVLAE